MIFPMIFKNLKIIFRSPFTIFLLILFPIMLMLVVGITYSGDSINNVKIGLIEEDYSFFENYVGLTFQRYNLDTVDSSIRECLNNLELSDVHICVHFRPVLVESELVGASITYYIDNTRPQISDILIRNLNYIVDSKTKEISTNTITEILQEVRVSVDFLKEGYELSSDLQEDLNLMNRELNSFSVNFEEYKLNLKNLEENFLNSINSLRSSIISISENSQENTFILKNLVSENRKQTLDIIDTLVLIEFGLKSYDDPNINNYRDILIDIINDLREIEKNLNTINNQVLSLENSQLGIFENRNVFLEDLSAFENLLKQNSNTLNSVSTNLNSLVEELKLKEIELINLNNELSSKIDYFESLASLDPNSLREPITKENKTLFLNFQRIHQLSPIIVILILLFIGLLLSNVMVSLEISSKAYFRTLISPVNHFQIIISLFLTSLFIISIQFLFLLFIINFYFKIDIFSNIFSILLVSFHVLFIFILFGMLFAFMFNSTQISILITTFTILFLFLLSNVIVPIEIMPLLISKIVLLNPVILGEDLLRQIFFFNLSLIFLDLIYFYPLILFLFLLVFYFSKRKLNNF